MADWYEQNSPAHRLFSFPIIRDEERFRAEQSLIAPFAATHVSRWQLEGKKVCLFVGRFVALKNLRALIEAFAAVVRKEEEKDSLRLVLVPIGHFGTNRYQTVNVAQQIHLSASFSALPRFGHVLAVIGHSI